mgnify:CR=1 FL=1
MANRKRKRTLSIRVSEEERALIARRMEQAGVRSLRAYVLKMTVDGYIVNLDLSDVREMVTLLRRSSSNLNQIAKRANETRSIYEADVADLQSRYDELWNQAAGILRALADMKR